MCGICGFTNFRDDDLLRGMNAALRHRGPDEDGFFISGNSVSLAMRRLKIIDLFTGSQPVTNEDGSVIVVFNGEIYNFKELRLELEAAGHKFKTHTDTEVLVHMYEQHGEGFAKFLRGMFAFALWDARAQKLLLVRDHFGIKPLFYALAGDKLFFASEIKALLKTSLISRELEPAALDAYFTRLYIPAPLTAYKQIKKLGPAQILVFQNGKISVRSYWSIPEFNKRAVKSESEYLAEIDSLLSKSVNEQLVSDVPLGLLLSGGMDSATLLYYMSRSAKAPVKTFTIGYGAKDSSFNETGPASRIAAQFKAEHHETILEPDIAGVITNLAAHFDEPFADSSAIPTWLVTKEARKKVTVALSGIGGDELFGGYPRYLGARFLPGYLALPKYIRKTFSAASSYFGESNSSANEAGRLKRFLRAGESDFSAGYRSWLEYLTAKEKSGLYGRLLKKLSCGPGFMLANAPGNYEEIFRYEVRNYLSDDLLALADRVSMANSLELRVPFLDTRLVELAAGMPMSLKTKGFTLKYPLKKLMAGRLNDEITGGAKRGFQVPLARWYNEEIKDFVRDTLKSSVLEEAGYLSGGGIDAMLKTHESGRRNFSDQIYAALVFELWRRSIENVNRQ